MAKQNKPSTAPPKRRKSSRGGAYWTLFALCAVLSFAGGFWYTYQATSTVSVKDPSAIDVPVATPIPNQAVATPDPDVPDEEPQETGTSVAAFDLGRTAAPEPTVPPQASTPAPARQEESEAKAEFAAAPSVYRVQVGSYSSREEAQAMVEELAVAGIDAMVVEDDGKYHAQIGAYATRERALAVADDVNTKGYSVTIRH